MPCPVAPAESDTLSGRARRGLDRALAVGGGLGGGGMHRVGACRGGGGGTGQPCVSYTQLAGGQGAGPGGGTGGRRSPAGRRAQVCAGVIGFLFPRSGVFESASIAGLGRMHYTPPIPQGIRVWKPGCKAQSRSRAHWLVRGFFVCAAHCTLYGGPCGDSRKGVPVLARSSNPTRSAAFHLEVEGAGLKPVDRSLLWLTPPFPQ